MNWPLLVLGLVTLFIYIFASVIHAALTNFWFHDTYPDIAFDQPRVRPTGVADDAFLVDLHCHTTASDGLLAPGQLVRWSIANGYDGLVVSDHNTMDAVAAVAAAAKEIDPEFVVVPGYEFTSMRAHVNLIGLRDPPRRKPHLLWTRKSTIVAAIEHVHEQGGVAMFNHRDWYPYNILRSLPRDWWLERGIDGWEVHNGFGFIDDGALPFIEASKEYRVMFPGAGTDVHDPAKHWRVYTEVLTTERSVDGVLRALKEGKTRVHFNKEDPRNVSRPEEGMVQANPERRAFIRRWAWLNWIGMSLQTGKRTRLAAGFVVAVIALLVVLSLLF